MSAPVTTLGRLEAASTALGKVAATDRGDVCWVSGDEADESTDWCLTCAHREADRLRKKHPKSEFFVGRACGAYEAESSCSCHGCGAPLDYSLLKYGVISEVGHFLDYPLTQDEGPHVAYEVEAILRGARYLNMAEHRYLIEDAVRIGETAVQLLGYRDDLARLADDGGPA